MDIEGSLRELGQVDSNPLIEAVLSQDEEAWEANQYRQQAYDVHTQTESLVMVFCDGWPEMKVTKESAWDDLKETAVPLMRHIIDNFYPAGGTVIRAMAANSTLSFMFDSINCSTSGAAISGGAAWTKDGRRPLRVSA